jgi:hypothetical protein
LLWTQYKERERESGRERERERERERTKHVFERERVQNMFLREREIEREFFLLKSANKEQALNHSIIFSTKLHTH